MRLHTQLTKANDALFINADVPGTDPKDIDIQYHENHLTINAPRNGLTKSTTYVLSDHIDVDNIQASCDKGVLTVSLPKKPSARSKRIPIN